MEEIVSELKFNLKFIKLVFLLYFDVLLEKKKKNRWEEAFGSPYIYSRTIFPDTIVTFENTMIGRL